MSEIRDLQKQMKDLGIINVEAEGTLSTTLLKDAINIVKEINLDFNKIAKESEIRTKRAK